MAAEVWARYDDGYPHFFVSIDSTGLDNRVSPLEAILTRCHASIDFKRLRGLHNEYAVSEFVLKAKDQAGLQRFWV